MLYDIRVRPVQLRAAAAWIEPTETMADVELRAVDALLVVGQGDDRAVFDTNGSPVTNSAAIHDPIAESEGSCALEGAIWKLGKAGYTEDEIIDAVRDTFSEVCDGTGRLALGLSRTSPARPHREGIQRHALHTHQSSRIPRISRGFRKDKEHDHARL